ncbi:MAG: CDP-glucose 4,6-dehydratase, partial [Solirubrobacteraceae bacterium]
DGAPEWTLDGSPNPPEATRLQLDSTRARTRLGWSPPWDLDTGLAQLVRWHAAHADGCDMRALSLRQLDDFLAASGVE